MPSPSQRITLADLEALATLANTKLTPPTPYVFPPSVGRDKIGLPAKLTITADYGAGIFNAGSKVTLRLYGYKTIAGKKSYTQMPLRKAFIGAAASGSFALTWTWVSVTGDAAPEGYIVVIPRPEGGGPALGWSYFWKDIGNVETFTEDGHLIGWHIDATLDAANEGAPADNLPCGHGVWLKVLNQIWFALFTQLDLFGGSRFHFTEDWLLSGPWVVSTGPRCYLTLNGSAVLKNLQFIYSEADSLTGNQLAPEAEMSGIYIGVKNGGNNFNWDANVLINGTIKFYSPGQGQNPANWMLAASHPGIAITVNPFDIDVGVFPNQLCTSFTFTFTDVQYTVGTPVVLTLTPLAGGSVVNPGNPAGAGGLVNCEFTGDQDTHATDDTLAIHPGDADTAPCAAKAAALVNSLPPIAFTSPTSAVTSLEAHYRAFCNGVYVAKTLPTLGEMTYLDVDLPQYNPLPPNSAEPASTRRTPRNEALPYQAVMANRGALWPIFPESDFTPDSVAGRPVNGSPAWQKSIATKAVSTSSNTHIIQPGGGAQTLFRLPIFVPDGSADVRFLTSDPNVIIYAKANNFPTVADYDASAPGGTWLSLAESDPGFPTGTTWFYGILNPTGAPITNTTTIVLIADAALPNGTFFPSIKDDSGATVAQQEGYTYHFPGVEGLTTFNPVPARGYCLRLITLRRQPKPNSTGVAVAPSAGTAALAVKIGVMKDSGFEVAGTFTEIQTITIPAGMPSLTVPLFLPVLSAMPLAIRCAETVAAMVSVNFQPMMHSTLRPETTQVNGADYVVGYYDGPLWYQPERTLLFFLQGFLNLPILLPLNAAVYNDLTSTFNLL